MIRTFSAPPVRHESTKPHYHPRSYTQFIKGIQNRDIPNIVVKPNKNVVRYEESNGDYGDVQIVQTEKLWETLIESGTDITIDSMQDVSLSVSLFIGFGLLYALSIFRMASPPQMPFMKTKEYTMEERVTTRFTDVEGIDSAKDELEEIVDFLKNPDRYRGSGAIIPKGALLIGQPGTGKTLLARAIAGESNVPFIQCSAASFIEMFVGVGAKRVRDLFQQARDNQPCIVFIDEIDAVGKKRSGNGLPSNDEREQTINQLLTEMDGFNNESEIVVIAATNRADILDEALLRPGRFDRKIQVSLPNVRGRETILGVHARGKTFADDVRLSDIAKQTTGFSGADLANLLNECAIRAVRDGGAGTITNDVIEDVYQRIIVGAKGDVTLSPQRKLVVATHEAGHAIMGILSPEYDTLRKVSIIPRGSAGGVTFFQPSEENADAPMYTREYLLSKVMVALGGRVAEEIVYGPDRITTGASSDYAQVYTIVRDMVTLYGLGKYAFDYRHMSQESSRLVDVEIHSIVDECYRGTMDMLMMHRPQLEKLTHKLVEDGIVDGQWVRDLFCDDGIQCEVDFS